MCSKLLKKKRMQTNPYYKCTLLLFSYVYECLPPVDSSTI